MKRVLAIILLSCGVLVLPAQAEEAGVNAGAEVQTEEGFFSRTWTNVKSFFGGDEQAGDEAASEQVASETDVQAEADVETETGTAQDESLVDTAAEKTKAGVDWTADKAKKGAEWTKDTAKDVTKATGKGVKKAGEAIEGMFPDGNDTSVDAEASADAEVESE